MSSQHQTTLVVVLLQAPMFVQTYNSQRPPYITQIARLIADNLYYDSRYFYDCNQIFLILMIYYVKIFMTIFESSQVQILLQIVLRKSWIEHIQVDFKQIQLQQSYLGVIKILRNVAQWVLDKLYLLLKSNSSNFFEFHCRVSRQQSLHLILKFRSDFTNYCQMIAQHHYQQRIRKVILQKRITNYQFFNLPFFRFHCIATQLATFNRYQLYHSYSFFRIRQTSPGNLVISKLRLNLPN
eukprot:TRINITY_DN4710_c0_g1_i8.p1 TRINITY_DN4710_c0_g1~~TRINITY_DN4710_c0_g1_i8.p1  ORF type:complete len:239 (-),score=-22.05 TRINITY_DN4710_c0_g1_i8:1-717(-)